MKLAAVVLLLVVVYAVALELGQAAGMQAGQIQLAASFMLAVVLIGARLYFPPRL